MFRLGSKNDGCGNSIHLAVVLIILSLSTWDNAVWYKIQLLPRYQHPKQCNHWENSIVVDGFGMSRFWHGKIDVCDNCIHFISVGIERLSVWLIGVCYQNQLLSKYQVFERCSCWEIGIGVEVFGMSRFQCGETALATMTIISYPSGLRVCPVVWLLLAIKSNWCGSINSLNILVVDKLVSDWSIRTMNFRSDEKRLRW